MRQKKKVHRRWSAAELALLEFLHSVINTGERLRGVELSRRAQTKDIMRMLQRDAGTALESDAPLAVFARSVLEVAGGTITSEGDICFNGEVLFTHAKLPDAYSCFLGAFAWLDNEGAP